MPPKKPDALPYLKTVVSTVKSNDPITFHLTEKVLIVGPNGEGKTARLNAIQLLIEAAAYDVAGRARIANNPDVLSLLSGPGNTRVAVEGTWSDGVTSSYEVVRSGKTASRTFKPRTDATLAGVDVRTAMAGSAETARVYFAGFVLGAVTRKEIVSALPDAFQTRYHALAEHATGTTEVEKLTRIVDSLNESVKKNRKDADVIESVVNTQANLLGPAPTDEQIEEAERAFQEASAERDAIIAAGARVPTLDEIEKLRISAETTFNAVGAEASILKKLRADRAALPDAPTYTSEKGVNTIKSAILLAKMDRPTCLACGGSMVGAAEQAAKLEAFLVSNAEAIGLYNTIASLNTQITASENRVRSAVAAAKDAATRYADARALAQSIDIDAYGRVTERAVNASRLLTELRAVRASYETLRGQRNTILDYRATAQAAETLVGEVVKVRDGLLLSRVKKFEEVVQKYLSGSMRFRLYLMDGDREVCRFGLESDEGELLPAPSGAQWEAIILAVSSAIEELRGSLTPKGPSVLIPVERAYDANTLRAMMAALSDSPSQVILTSTVKPAGRVPAGWTILDLTE